MRSLIHWFKVGTREVGKARYCSMTPPEVRISQWGVGWSFCCQPHHVIVATRMRALFIHLPLRSLEKQAFANRRASFPTRLNNSVANHENGSLELQLQRWFVLLYTLQLIALCDQQQHKYSHLGRGLAVRAMADEDNQNAGPSTLNIQEDQQSVASPFPSVQSSSAVPLISDDSAPGSIRDDDSGVGSWRSTCVHEPQFVALCSLTNSIVVDEHKALRARL
jgi:hypothetical protein